MTGIMAAQNLVFAPFRGLRYAEPDTLSVRLAPPYDVITPEDRRALTRLDPQNIVNIDLPVAAPGEDPYATAADLLRLWQRRGTLVRDSEPCAYVLRTTSTLADGRTVTRTGVFLAVAAMPFNKGGRVRPHERTHAGPKEDRRRLMLATGCNVSPVFLLAPDSNGDLASQLDDITGVAPWAVAEALGGRHEMWIAKGQLGLRLAMWASEGHAYIADGHHRYETAAMLREDRDLPKAWAVGAQRTLAHLVSFKDPGLVILPTHRMVEGKPLERSVVLKAANPYFERALKGQMPHFTVVFQDGSEAAMRLREQADLSAVTDMPQHASVRDLAVTVADTVFINTVLKGLIKLRRGDTRPQLKYTPVEAEAVAAVKAGEAAVTLVLPPTTLDEVRAVSDAGEFMPPKSTFFAPKVPTGAVMRLFEGEA